MRQGLLSSLAVAAVAVPTLVFAAYSSPSDLLRAAKLQGEPMDISYELHGQAEGVSASAWLKGSVEASDPKDISTAKGALRLTVDVAVPGEGTVRIKTQLRMKDSVAYVQLEGVSGTARDLPVSELRPYIGTWYSIPLDELEEGMTGEMAMDQEEAEEMILKVLDSILSLQRMPDGNGSVYSLKLKRTAWKDIVPVLTELAEQEGSPMPAPSNRDLAELRKVFQKLNLHIKVTTDARDEVTGIKFYAAMRDRAFHFVFQGTATVRSTPVTVTVPRNATPLEELMGSSYEDMIDSPASLEEARDAQRRSDVNTILNAIYQYAIDNNGNFPAGITMSPKEICYSHMDKQTTCPAGTLDLSVLIGSYLVAIPRDPEIQSGNRSGYRIWKDANGRVTVDAPGAETAAEISVTR